VNLWRINQLEADVQQRVQVALSDMPAVIAVEGRDVLLRGQMPSEDAIHQLKSRVGTVEGVRHVISTLILPPEIKPFVTEFKRDASGVTVTGYVPPESAERVRQTLRDTFSNQTIKDQTSLARGAAPDTSVALLSALQHLSLLSEGQINFTDASYSITGIVKDVNTFEQLESALQQLPQTIKIVRQEIKIAQVSPFIWTAQKNAEGYTLSGYAPSLNLRQNALENAASDGRKVLDQQRLANGLPSGIDFKAVTTFALRALTKFDEGKVTLTDKTLSIIGHARDAQSDQEVTRSFANILPGGVQAGNVDISVGKVSPYTMSAVRDARYITLTGYVPDAKTKADLATIVRRRFLGEGLQDQTKIAAGAPASYLTALSTALDQLARLSRGRVDVSDTTLKVTGEALYERARDDIRSQIASMLPANWKGTAAIEVRLPDTVIPPSECQNNLVDLMGRGRILFESGNANIYKDSFGLLDNLVFLLKRCPEGSVHISGHTDNDGDEATNVDLSRRRAQAVADYLTSASIETSRVIATGYGSSRPLVPNENDEAKARNRRIEFLVK
jgi:OOP family OmpA-OmpF porin